MCRVMWPDVARALLSAPTDIQTGAHCFGSSLSVPVQQESNYITSSHLKNLCCDTLKVNSVLRTEQTEGQGEDKGVGQLTRQNVPHTGFLLPLLNASFDLQEFVVIRADSMIQREHVIDLLYFGIQMASRWVLQNRHTNRFLLIHATGFGSHSLNYFLHNHALYHFIHELSHYIGSTIYAWML